MEAAEFKHYLREFREYKWTEEEMLQKAYHLKKKAPADFGMLLSEYEEIANAEFEKVGDEGLFPNHSDKDIWIGGFMSAITFIFSK